MNGSIIQLLVLAGIAIFLILRLKSVLGSRDGFELPPSARQIPERSEGTDEDTDGPDRDILDHVGEGTSAARALEAMKRAEPGFSASGFLQGARGAYEMILMAFEKGELHKVKAYMAPEVFEAFSSAVEARRDKGLTVTAEFLGLREMVLEDASFDTASSEGEVTVRFVAEIISAARDLSGAVVEGDPQKPRRQRDVWTFARRMGGNDPNWQLVATGE